MMFTPSIDNPPFSQKLLMNHNVHFTFITLFFCFYPLFRNTVVFAALLYGAEISLMVKLPYWHMSGMTKTLLIVIGAFHVLG